MDSRKVVFVIAVQLILESCSVLSQCIQVPQTCAVTSYSMPMPPITQFVIPAVIKPLIQETCVKSTPCVGNCGGYSDFSGFEGPGFGGGYPAPIGGMPPIICKENNGSNKNLMLYLLMLLSTSCGGGCGGCGCGCSGGYGGGCCGGGCGGGCCGGGCCGGGCGSSCGCGCSYGGGYGCNCGGGYGNSGCGCCNGYGNCGSRNGGFNGNNGCGCGCGYGCNYNPYTVQGLPCGCNAYDNSNVGDCSFNGGGTQSDIKLLIRTDDQCDK